MGKLALKEGEIIYTCAENAGRDGTFALLDMLGVQELFGDELLRSSLACAPPQYAAPFNGRRRSFEVAGAGNTGRDGTAEMV